MNTVTVSPKYQVVIPKAVREALAIEPGQRLQVLVFEGRIVLVPVRRPEELRGSLVGLDTRVEREGDRV
jgi:AbrB family looped-hinge helix DNA binding protein